MNDKVEDKLAITLKELEDLKAEYQEFVYVVSHDLHAPLRQISGFTELLQSKYAQSFDEKSKRHIELVLAGSAKAKNVLDGLVSYSRLNTNKEGITQVDCNTIVEEVKQQLSAKIESTDAEIIISSLPTVNGDKLQIKQVFYHLIHNALHYKSENTRPKVTLDVEDIVNYWQFCIRDNGLGIPPHLAGKIFKPLRRAVSDKHFSGIGMGLTIVKKIITWHGGKLWLAEREQLGASFYFTLPKVRPHE